MPDSTATAAGTLAEKAKAALSQVEARPGVPKPDPILVADHVKRSPNNAKLHCNLLQFCAF